MGVYCTRRRADVHIVHGAHSVHGARSARPVVYVADDGKLTSDDLQKSYVAFI